MKKQNVNYSKSNNPVKQVIKNQVNDTMNVSKHNLGSPKLGKHNLGSPKKVEYKNVDYLKSMSKYSKCEIVED